MEKILIIGVVAFLFFGPDKLPELARTVGKFMREFRKVQEEMETTIRSEIYKVDLSAASPDTVAAIAGTKPATAEEGESAPKDSAPMGQSAGWAEEHEEESEE